MINRINVLNYASFSTSTQKNNSLHFNLKLRSLHKELLGQKYPNLIEYGFNKNSLEFKFNFILEKRPVDISFKVKEDHKGKLIKLYFHIFSARRKKDIWLIEKIISDIVCVLDSLLPECEMFEVNLVGGVEIFNEKPKKLKMFDIASINNSSNTFENNYLLAKSEKAKNIVSLYNSDIMDNYIRINNLGNFTYEGLDSKIDFIKDEYDIEDGTIIFCIISSPLCVVRNEDDLKQLYDEFKKKHLMIQELNNLAISHGLTKTNSFFMTQDGFGFYISCINSDVFTSDRKGFYSFLKSDLSLEEQFEFYKKQLKEEKTYKETLVTI